MMNLFQNHSTHTIKDGKTNVELAKVEYKSKSFAVLLTDPICSR